MHHSKLWRTGKIVQETVQQPESTHKPLTFANLGRIELGSGLAHPVVSDAGSNGATGRLRSELEADVTKMMKVPQLKVSRHHDLGFYGKKGFERESTRIRDFIPAGPVPLFPQGCPFIPAGPSFYSRRAVILFPQGWRSSPGRHLAPARPAPTAMAGIRAARHEGPRR